MKKIIIICLICLISFFCFGFSAENGGFTLADYDIKVGDAIYDLDYPVYAKDGVTYISLRDICRTLRIPLHWDEENRIAHVDEFHKKVVVSDKTEYKNEGVIPDEETALAIGKIILEKYVGRELEYETEDKRFYLKAISFDHYGADVWEVYQTYEYLDGRKWAGSGFSTVQLYLSKTTGEVISICTYSDLEEW